MSGNALERTLTRTPGAVSLASQHCVKRDAPRPIVLGDCVDSFESRGLLFKARRELELGIAGKGARRGTANR